MQEKKRWREEVLKMRFFDVYTRFKGKILTCEQAADILGISQSSFYRMRQRYKEDQDIESLGDRRVGRISAQRASDEEVEFLTNLYKNKYRSFNMKHFYSLTKEEYPKKRSYNWVRKTLVERGCVAKRRAGRTHRKKRERQALEGMMLHQDGSSHRWIRALEYDVDLIVTLDDATSQITSAFFVPEEGTMSSLQGIKETIERKGVFCTLYTDRGSHYFYTAKAGEKVDKKALTQVGRALKQLRIHHIAAYSPEARGRSERAFRTLQGRLPQEMELCGIKNIEEANVYLRETFIPRYNKEFSIPAKEESQKAFIPWAGRDLEDILCLQESRIVRKDNTVSYEGQVLQIPKTSHRFHYGKAQVMVHKYIDGTLGLFYGPMCLGKYNQKGQILRKSSSLQQSS